MLSDAKILNAKPAPKAYKLYDGGGLGLFLEVTPSGSRRWRVKYFRQVREPMRDLGLWPQAALQGARGRAAAVRKALGGRQRFRRHGRAHDASGSRRGPGLETPVDAALRYQAKIPVYRGRPFLPYFRNTKSKRVAFRPSLTRLSVLWMPRHAGALYSAKTIRSWLFIFPSAGGHMEWAFTLCPVRGAAAEGYASGGGRAAGSERIRRIRAWGGRYFRGRRTEPFEGLARPGGKESETKEKRLPPAAA
ncbi:MAG: Arm DNA-binding domain-containing protein [Deltaproteobacteria bacterium]|jgi:hypothetical protein|nr:Arm DNA-binding domain-containing protein [Deltaproteobacteria bacterium]